MRRIPARTRKNREPLLQLDPYVALIIQSTLGEDVVNAKRLTVVVVFGLLGLCSVPTWAANAAPDESQPKKYYPVLGLVIGTPSLGVNAVVGYDLGPVEMRLSGGVGNPSTTSKDLHWGFQLDLGYKRIDTKNVVMQVGLFASYVNQLDTSPPQAVGAGMGASLFLYGFFADLGIGMNFLPTDLTGFDVITGELQIGYMYRFN
jgi:hypothetical protein